MSNGVEFFPSLLQRKQQQLRGAGAGAASSSAAGGGASAQRQEQRSGGGAQKRARDDTGAAKSSQSRMNSGTYGNQKKADHKKYDSKRDKSGEPLRKRSKSGSSSKSDDKKSKRSTSSSSSPVVDDKDKTKSQLRREQQVEKKKKKNPNYDNNVHVKQLLEEFRVLNANLEKQKKLKKLTLEERMRSGVALGDKSNKMDDSDSDSDDDDENNTQNKNAALGEKRALDMSDAEYDALIADLARQRAKKMEQVYSAVKGHGFEYATKGDMSRVIQAMLKYGTAEQRKVLYERELRGKLVQCCDSMYGHHIVETLFRYVCNDANLVSTRPMLYGELRGKVMWLLSRKYSASVIDVIYSRYANKQEKFLILSEFYGTAVSELDDRRELETRTIAEIVREHPGKRIYVAQTLGKLVKDKLIAKGLVDFVIVHRLMSDLFEIGEKGDINDVVSDIADSNVLPFILHTKHGCRAAMYCISYASPRVRKLLIKSLEGAMAKAVTDTYGVLVLCRLLDLVDDTAFTIEKILEPVLQEGSGELPTAITTTPAFATNKIKAKTDDDSDNDEDEDSDGDDDAISGAAQLASLFLHRNACKLFLHLLNPFNKSYFQDDLWIKLLAPKLRSGVITSFEKRLLMEKEELERRKGVLGERFKPEEQEMMDRLDAMITEMQQKKQDAGSEKDAEDEFDPLLMQVCRLTRSEKRHSLVPSFAKRALEMLASDEGVLRTLLCDMNAANVVFELLRMENYSLVVGNDEEVRQLRRTVLQHIVTIATATSGKGASNSAVTVLDNMKASRTICTLIMSEKLFWQQQQPSTPLELSKDGDVLSVLVLNKLGNKFAQFAMSHAGAPYLVSALLKTVSGKTEQTMKKSLMASVQKFEKRAKELESSKNDAQDAKSYQMLVRALTNDSEEQARK